MLLNWLAGIIILFSMTGASLSETPLLNLKEKTAEEPTRINSENIGVKVTAEKYFALDVDSGKVLAEKNYQDIQPIASITKIMTALVILEQKPNWEKTVEMTASDETYGAFAHIYRGEKVRFIDLWKSALITSDNNSIMAMIRSMEISREEFVNLMNAKAKELNLKQTKFADPTGLNKENVSSAADVARLLYVALHKNEIRESVEQSQYTFNILESKKNRKILSTDILLDSFINSSKWGYELIGGKTGFLPEAGYCLAVQTKKDGHEVIIVVLNSSTMDDRFQDVKALADWVFTNYNWTK